MFKCQWWRMSIHRTERSIDALPFNYEVIGADAMAASEMRFLLFTKSTAGIMLNSLKKSMK